MSPSVSPAAHALVLPPLERISAAAPRGGRSRIRARGVPREPFCVRRVVYAEFAVYSLILVTLLAWSVGDRDELAAAVDWARNEHARLSAEDCKLLLYLVLLCVGC